MPPTTPSPIDSSSSPRSSSWRSNRSSSMATPPSSLHSVKIEPTATLTPVPPPPHEACSPGDEVSDRCCCGTRYNPILKLLTGAAR